MSRPGDDAILRWPLFRPLDLRAKDSRMSEIDTCAPERGERDPKPNTPDPSNPNATRPRPSAIRTRALGATLRKSAEQKKSGLAIVEKMPACRKAARPRGQPVTGR